MKEDIRKYAPLVRRLAHQMVARLPANVELDDMVQAGMIGLMDAIGRFEENQGTAFEVYASARIRGAMLDELRANDWLPRSARKSQRDIENAIHRIEGRLKRAPTEAEIARELGIGVLEYQEMLNWCTSTTSAAATTTMSTWSGTSPTTAPNRARSCATSASAPRWWARSRNCPSASAS
jgi:FliA/WhiG family RNA polymerase sigma factor